jgi:hypothetical protein
MSPSENGQALAWTLLVDYYDNADVEAVGVDVETMPEPSDNFSGYKGGRFALLTPFGEDGLETADRICLRLAGAGATVRRVDLPGRERYGSFDDWRAAHNGDTRKLILEAIERAPEVRCVPPVSPGTSLPPSPEFDGPPRPLRSILRPVPEFAPELLPEPVQDWAKDVADRMQCSIEFIAVGIAIVLACLLGRKVGIRPKRHDNWTVVGNLWGMVVGRPGVLKSPALEEVLRVLQRLAAEAREHYSEELEGYQ